MIEAAIRRGKGIDEFGREQRIRLRKNATEKDYWENFHTAKKP